MKKAALLFGVVISVLFISQSFYKTQKKIIVIDAGHGGDDNGAFIDNLNEKEITLKIAQKVKELSGGSNLEVILTRESDEHISLEERVKKIKSINPAYVISLHINFSDNTELNGVDLFINKNNEQSENSKQYAEKLTIYYPNEIHTNAIKDGPFYLLKQIECPATMVELGYLSNKNDLGFLANDLGQDEIASAIYKSIN